MYPATLINRRRRPRRTLDHLFGDEENLGLPEDVPVTRPRTTPARTDEFAPYEGTRPVGSFAGDAPAPIARALPPAVRPAFPELPPQLAPVASETLETIGAPPVYPTRPQRDVIAEDAQILRDLRSKPVERSRAKSAGVGFLRKGIFGSIVGALNPEMYGEMKRDREIKRIEERIGSDLEIRKAQRAIRLEPLQEDLLRSQVNENKAQAEARLRPPRPILGRDVMEDGTTIQTELNSETGVFEPSTREGRPIVLSRPKPGEPLVEMSLSTGERGSVPFSRALEVDATRTGRVERAETKAEEREGQKLAAQDEFDQLTADEIAAGDEKNRAYAYLESLKANPNVTEDDIREATRAAEAANVLYRSFGPKKAAAKAKITRYSGSGRPDRPSNSGGKRWSASRWAAANPQGDVNIAKIEARRQGFMVVE